MVFVAKGKLLTIKRNRLGFGKKIACIVAEMHEGWLGSNHVVKLVLDSKFTEEVAKNLKYRHSKLDMGEYNTEWVEEHLFGSKDIREHTIEIIIK